MRWADLRRWDEEGGDRELVYVIGGGREARLALRGLTDRTGVEEALSMRIDRSRRAT